MPDAGQPELQLQLRALSQRLRELSARSTGAAHAEEYVTLFQEKRRLEASLRAAPKPRFRNQSMENSNKAAHDGRDSNSVLANVNQELRKLEKRDGELWLIAPPTTTPAVARLLALPL